MYCVNDEISPYSVFKNETLVNSQDGIFFKETSDD